MLVVTRFAKRAAKVGVHREVCEQHNQHGGRQNQFDVIAGFHPDVVADACGDGRRLESLARSAAKRHFQRAIRLGRQKLDNSRAVASFGRRRQFLAAGRCRPSLSDGLVQQPGYDLLFGCKHRPGTLAAIVPATTLRTSFRGRQIVVLSACSTPDYDADSRLLFSLGVDGDLNAWDTLKSGKRVWSLNLYDRYQAPRRPEVAKRKKTQRDYGYTSSPLVLGDQVIVEVGGNQGNLVAFNKRDGRELWESENRDEAGHTGGPVPITVEGVPCVAVLTLRNLVVTRIDGANAGKTVATYPWTTDFGNNIATAAVAGDSVIITSAYNHSAMCRLQITLGGAKQVWETKGIASGVCTPIIHAGHVYWAWRGVHCVDFETGKEVWVGGKVGSQGSCILTSDERLIVYANQGDLTLVETAKRSPNKYTELASKQVLSTTDAWPHVVLAAGKLICRDRDGSVRCLSVR